MSLFLFLYRMSIQFYAHGLFETSRQMFHNMFKFSDRKIKFTWLLQVCHTSENMKRSNVFDVVSCTPKL